MTRDEIFSRLENVLHEEKGADFTVSPDLALEALAEDSVEIMELVLSLEDAFGLEINDEEMDQFKQVADILDFLEIKLK